MADNYLEFSELLTNLSDEEAAWLENQLEIVQLRDGVEVEESTASAESADSTKPTWTGCRAYVDMDDYDGTYGGDVGFEYEFYEQHDKKGRYLWIYAEEHGYVDRVAHLVQKFLRQFRPDQTWSLTYSVTCSKPRAGDFGGGAVVVSATDIKWFNAWDFVEEQKHKSKLRIVLDISGGVVQDVYCSDPQAECVIVDWDCCELDDEVVGAVEVDGEVASITQHEVCPLDKLAGTDVEAALIKRGYKV